jgi:hypothetical protein
MLVDDGGENDSSLEALKRLLTLLGFRSPPASPTPTQPFFQLHANGSGRDSSYPEPIL